MEHIVEFLRSMDEPEMADEVANAHNRLECYSTGITNEIIESLRSVAEKSLAQLAAAQEDNQKLRIALDSTKRDLIRMRCPDFFEGVRDGYEFSFDNHLVNMIGLINDYAKQK